MRSGVTTERFSRIEKRACLLKIYICLVSIIEHRLKSVNF